ncbi:MAG: choice-of-anchor Q domain-containing protein, partial [Acidobacteriota bacterium]
MAVLLLGGLPLAAQTAFVGQWLGGVSTFNSPQQVTVDSAGNVYVADTSYVYEVPPNCTSAACVTVLGGGFAGPIGVAVDSAGNVYVADGSSLIYVMPPNCETFQCVQPLPAWSGNYYPNYLTLDSKGNLFVSRTFGVSEIPAGCTTGSCIKAWSGIGSTRGIAVDSSGNVYVADETSTSDFVLKIPPGCGTASCMIKLGDGAFSDPWGLAIDSKGNLYVGDLGISNSIKEIPAGCTASSCVSTVASGVNGAYGLAIDSSDNLYVSDLGDTAVREIQPLGFNFGSLAVGAATPATQTVNFTFTSGGTLAATPYSVLTQGAPSMDFTAAATQPANACVTGHTYNTNDTCAVTVAFSPKYPGPRRGAVELLNSAGGAIATAYLTGTGTGPQVTFSAVSGSPAVYNPAALTTLGSGFSFPAGLAVDGAGNVFVADTGNSAVKEIVAAGGYTTVNTLGSGFLNPFGVAVDGAGNVFVADSNNSEVKEIVAAGGYTTVNTLGSGFLNPFGVAVDGAGNVFVADYGNNAVKEIVAAGGYTTVNTLGSGFSRPTGVAVDGAGNVFVADAGNNAVKEIVAAGGYTTVNTLGGVFSFLFGVAVDGAGNVFVADRGNNAVKEIVAAGGYTTVNTLGSGFNVPFGAAVDGAGNIFVADNGNNAVKKMQFSQPPSLSFATTNVFNGNSSDSPQTVEVANDGNAPLTFPPPSTGNNPSAALANDFTVDWSASGACPQLDTSSSTYTLAAGASCTIPIIFAPQDIGTDAGSLVLTDNSLNAQGPAYTTQTISFSGQGNGVPSVTIGINDQSIYSSGPQEVVLQAQVMSGGLPVSGGSVTFTVLQGSAAVGLPVSGPVSGGFATVGYTLPPGLAPGSYTIRAEFTGMDDVGASSNSSAQLIVTAATATAVAPVPSMAWSAASQQLSLAAKVSGVGTAVYDLVNEGAVTFEVLQGSTVEGAPLQIPVVGGLAVGNYTLPAGLPAGTYTISATYSDSSGAYRPSSDSSQTLTVTIPNFVVTTAQDDAGTASLCTPQSTPGTGSDASCSLRDALLAAANAGGANITFSSTVFAAANTAAQNTITLANGTLNIPTNTTITGATSGSGTTLANLVTVSGNKAATVFTVASGVTGASISNLTIADGSAANGGGIDNSGVLTVSESTLSGNTATQGNGGGIYNSGTLTVTGSTIAGNSLPGGNNSDLGGGIFSSGTLTVVNSTLSGNSAGSTSSNVSGEGGGIFILSGTATIADSTISGNSASEGSINVAFAGGIYISSGTVALANSIVAGNTVNQSLGAVGYADIEGNYTDNGGNLAGNNNSPTSTINPLLGALAGNGGPTQTMVPLGGSPALCAGNPARIPGGVTTDQRGFPRTTMIGGSACVDAGAVQAGYILTFSVNPPATVTALEPFSATVTLSENGAVIPLNGNVTLSLVGAGTLGGVTAVSMVNGVAAFTGLTVNTAGSNLQLQANASGLTALSTSFNVAALPPSVTGINPTTGPAAGGSPVVISGSNFTGATAVTFGGVAARFIVNSSTSIAATAPPGAGAVDILVTANGKTSVTSAADLFTYVVPTVTTLTPTVTPQTAFVYNSQPAISVALLGASATALPTSDFTATLDGSTPLAMTAGAGTNVFNIALPATPLTVGSHSIAVNFLGVLAGAAPYYAASSANIALTVTAPKYVVNNTGDPVSGNAANCPPNPSGSGPGLCTLRDALAAAANAGGGNITFDNTVFAAAQTIVLGGAGTLNIPSNTTVSGPSTGSGATLTNLVTVSGAHAYTVFSVNSGVTAAAIDHLNIANGSVVNDTAAYGGGINNSGTLTVSNSTISGNTVVSAPASGVGNSYGGGIHNSGTLTVTNSTFIGNTAMGPGYDFGAGIYSGSGTLRITNSTFSQNFAQNGTNSSGGAIYIGGGTLTVTNSTIFGNSATAGGSTSYGGGIFSGGGTLTVINSTISGNFATAGGGTGYGGGIFSSSPVNMSNSILSGNSSNSGPDCSGSSCPTNGVNGNVVGVSNPGLAALGNYGGPTQTMLPLPGSAAICAGSYSAAQAASLSADQRGVGFGNTGAGSYCASGSVDAGSVQTNYSLLFMQQPSNVIQNAAMSPAPQVELLESGVPFADGTDSVAIPLTLTTGNGALSGGTASTSATTGIATYPALSISLPGASDQLTAMLSVNPTAVPPVTVSLPGNSFMVANQVTQLVFTTAPPATLVAGGNAGTVVVTEEDANGQVVSLASDTIQMYVSGPNF